MMQIGEMADLCGPAVLGIEIRMDLTEACPRRFKKCQAAFFCFVAFSFIFMSDSKRRASVSSSMW